MRARGAPERNRHGLARRSVFVRGLPLAIWLGTLLLFGSSPALAEVMDKEPARAEIWALALVSVAIAALVSFVHPWLLTVSYWVGPAARIANAWTEWHDPFVGPAIRVEAGPGYGAQVDAAMTLVVVAHLAAWVAARSGSSPPRSRRSDAAFALIVLGETVLHSLAGFNFTWPALASAPALMVQGVALVALWRCRGELLAMR